MLQLQISRNAMSKVSRAMVTGLVLLLLLANVSFAEVLFSDTFDDQVDWQPRPDKNDASPGGASAACDFGTVKCTWPIPAGWSYFRTTGLWWGPLYQDTIRITSQAGRGGSGKAFIVYNESNIGASGDGWGADGQLTKLFNQDYQELYARVWIKTQVGWQWPSVQDMMIKMFRAYHFDRTGSIYNFFSRGKSAPIYLWGYKHSNTYGTRGINTFRGDPQETRYDPKIDFDYLLVPGNSTVAPSSSGMPADGNWHSLEFHVKINTFDPVNNAWNSDGVMELWNDGTLTASRYNILWKSKGSASSIGWNTIGLGGNAYNNYSGPANKAEQWYAMDDVVVSETYSGPPPKPLNVSAQGATDTAIKVTFRPGTNGAHYPLDGYRIYYGTDSGNLTNFVTASALATEVTVSKLAPGTTYFFEVTSFNQSASDINENESLRSSAVSALTVSTILPVVAMASVPSPAASHPRSFPELLSENGSIVTASASMQRYLICYANGNFWSHWESAEEDSDNGNNQKNAAASITLVHPQ